MPVPSLVKVRRAVFHFYYFNYYVNVRVGGERYNDMFAYMPLAPDYKINVIYCHYPYLIEYNAIYDVHAHGTISGSDIDNTMSYRNYNSRNVPVKPCLMRKADDSINLEIISMEAATPTCTCLTTVIVQDEQVWITS